MRLGDPEALRSVIPDAARRLSQISIGKILILKFYAISSIEVLIFGHPSFRGILANREYISYHEVGQNCSGP